MSVTYEELAGSPTEIRRFSTAVENIFEGVRKLKCAWSDRNSLVEELLNTPYPYWTDYKFYPVAFKIYPYSDGSAVQPISGTPGAATYDYAIVEVHYGVRPASGGTNLFTFVEKLERGSMAISFDPGELKYSDGTPVSLGARPTIHVPILLYEYIVTGIVGPTAGAYSLCGYVNSTIFSTKSLGLSWGPDRVLCGPVNVRSHFHQAGTAHYRWAVPFQIHPVSWQYEFNPSTGEWQALVKRKNNTAIYKYPRANLNAIFL